ncbi:large conductance mechanosensitive channel protein MscL [Enterococcus villorum]|uniref:Large-conductance mechanosensitive channel n=2 Tax=Enterococcus villorum TaxID=112904 RepID=A0A511J1G8_9ENTE|nr:large conductance mechanosensitive channel protein MscL [Enterococcus villorum]EOH94076.1 large conductance mechanosensitive channel protein [Enterococcus villorum ATCC 700913]EOW77100.1 large conductance mechanosensitive channel protein [Enterococcus villorum ATCC 700913]GEL91493.1 large-conductance mechanosensitive channel MscL [Enterococcus villorum]
MIKEFKEFIMRGDVLDLAVGVVIGSAFTSIVNQVVQGLITPLVGWIVAMITGTSDLEGALSILDWSPTKGVTFAFGDVISAIITFIITGFVLFLVVKAANHAKKLRSTKEEETIATPTAEDYLSDIRDLLAQQTAENNGRPTTQATVDPTKK